MTARAPRRDRRLGLLRVADRCRRDLGRHPVRRSGRTRGDRHSGRSIGRVHARHGTAHQFAAHRVPYGPTCGRCTRWACDRSSRRVRSARCSPTSIPGRWWSSISWSTARRPTGHVPRRRRPARRTRRAGDRCTTRPSPIRTTPTSGHARRGGEAGRRRCGRRRDDGGDQRSALLDPRREPVVPRQMGWHVVNMTGYPEAVLAAELGMPYASIASRHRLRRRRRRRGTGDDGPGVRGGARQRGRVQESSPPRWPSISTMRRRDDARRRPRTAASEADSHDRRAVRAGHGVASLCGAGLAVASGSSSISVVRGRELQRSNPACARCRAVRRPRRPTGWHWRFGWGLVGAPRSRRWSVLAVRTGWFGPGPAAHRWSGRSSRAPLRSPSRSALTDGSTRLVRRRRAQHRVPVQPSGDATAGATSCARSRDRIDGYSVHIRGHPPGFVLMLKFWLPSASAAPGRRR